MKVTVIIAVIDLIIVSVFIGLIVLVVRAILKYLKSKDVRQEKSTVRKSLGEALRGHRTRCKMTQEFVAVTLSHSKLF